MVGAAKTSVNAWKFQPAAVDGKPRASRLTVVFLYRPADYGHAAVLPPKDFIPVIPRDQTVGDEYVPVGLLSFDYPNYPVNSVAWGSVVVQVTVDSAGEVKDVNSLHGMTVFDNFALDALKKWHFRPGTFRGKPVTSKVVVAFVFQTPLSVP
jgi:TonB family protein